MTTIHVNSAGVADTAPPYARDAINRLKQKASAARATAQSATPSPAPAPNVSPTANVTPKGGGGVVNRIRGVVNGTRGGIVGKTLSKAAPVAGALATGDALADSAAQDSTARYAERFGVSEPTGDGSAGDIAKFALLRAGGFASDLGNKLTGGIAGRFYRDRPDQRDGAQAATGEIPMVNQQSQPEPGTGPITPESGRGSLVDDPTYIPQTGTGIVRNNRTGAEYDIAGNAGVQQPEEQSDVTNPAKRQEVRVPNLSMLTDVDALPMFLGQLANANQAVVNNRAQSNREQGIVASKRNAREAQTEELDIKSQERLDGIMEELIGLDDSNDPDGARRGELERMALTLRGGSTRPQEQPTDTPEDRYLRALTSEAFNEYQTPEERDEAQSWVNQQIEAYRQRNNPGAASNAAEQSSDFQEGKVYTDGDGNRARYQNGEFVPV